MPDGLPVRPGLAPAASCGGLAAKLRGEKPGRRFRTQKERLRPRGWAEPSGQLPKRLTVGDAAREEERPQSREANIAGAGSRNKREVGNGAMRALQAIKPLIQNSPKRFDKKRGSIRRWSLERSGRSQIQSSGKWTWEEDTPFAGWVVVEGGGFD